MMRLLGMSLNSRYRPAGKYTGPSAHRMPVARRSTAMVEAREPGLSEGALGLFERFDMRIRITTAGQRPQRQGLAPLERNSGFPEWPLGRGGGGFQGCRTGRHCPQEGASIHRFLLYASEKLFADLQRNDSECAKTSTLLSRGATAPRRLCAAVLRPLLPTRTP